MAQRFSAQIAQWVKDVDGAAEAVFREASQQVLSQAQASVPVDSGFLRASLQAELNAEPDAIPDWSPASPGERYSGPQGGYVATVGASTLGDTIKARWTAKYAGYVEYGTSRMAARGFVRQAVQRWPQIVAAAEAKLGAILGR